MSRKPILLVVDDNAAVLHLLDVALSAEGFEVLLASDAQEAIRHYRHHKGAVNLVLTDINMPGLSGPELVETLGRWNPAVRYCFMTGGSGEGVTPLFFKPLDLEGLTQALWNLLEDTRADAAA